MSHPSPLDHPIWSALTLSQNRFDVGGGPLAKRFPSNISPFIAPLDNTVEAIAATVDLIKRGDEVSMLQVNPPAAPAGIIATEATCIQMLCQSLSDGGQSLRYESLSDHDAQDMLDLATLTRPGPFRLHTHTLGRFIGVRKEGQLIAMAGERLQLPGFHEVSAVCTHPDHQGRGYGAALIRAIAGRILEEGDIPFLHSYPTNTGAVALYRKLGFETRTEVTHAVWKRA